MQNVSSEKENKNNVLQSSSTTNTKKKGSDIKECVTNNNTQYLQTVKDNELFMTNKERERAKNARELQNILGGHPHKNILI